MLHRVGAWAPGRRTSALGVALLLALGVVAAGCVPVAPPPPPAVLSISTTPGMYPAFNPSSTDYVSRCNASTPLTVSVGAPVGTSVSVNYQPWQAGVFNDTVPLAEGQSTVVAVIPPSGPEVAYWIRCLPADFPNFTVQQNAPSQAAGFIAMVNGPSSSRCTVFDNQGVPVWWSPNVASFFCTLLPDGNVGWIYNGNLEEHALDGATLTTISPTGGPADNHDLLLLTQGPDAGDYVLVAETTRSGVDLTALGGPSSTSVLDPVIEVFQPNGTLVWSWDTYDHIPVSQMDPQWYGQYIAGGSAPYDTYHWNSIEYTGSGFVVSYRHLDAVFDIDQSSGTLVWKLGSYSGQASSEVPGVSLTVQNDPVFDGGSHLGGQHDARLDPDGSVTLYDDGTNLGRAPRAVRYTIDTTAMTATYDESVTDPSAPGASPCCGSARKLATGDWVIGWGGTQVATENEADGTEVLRQQFDSSLIYRMVPLTATQFDLDALRQGMDAQYAAAATLHPETAPAARTVHP